MALSKLFTPRDLSELVPVPLVERSYEPNYIRCNDCFMCVFKFLNMIETLKANEKRLSVVNDGVLYLTHRNFPDEKRQLMLCKILDKEKFHRVNVELGRGREWPDFRDFLMMKDVKGMIRSLTMVRTMPSFFETLGTSELYSLLEGMINLEEFTLEDYRKVDTFRARKKIPFLHLKKLTIDHPDPSITKLFQGTRNLTHLSLVNHLDQVLLERNNQLKYFQLLINEPTVLSESFLLKSYPSVQELTVCAGGNSMICSVFVSFILCFRNVKKLNLFVNCPFVDDLSGFKSLRRLKEVNLYFTWTIPVPLPDIDIGDNLLTLSIRSAHKYRFSELRILALKNPKIRNLRLTGEIDNSIFSLLGLGFHELRHLALSFHTNYNSTTLKLLSTMQLKYFSINHTSKEFAEEILLMFYPQAQKHRWEDHLLVSHCDIDRHRKTSIRYNNGDFKQFNYGISNKKLQWE